MHLYFPASLTLAALGPLLVFASRTTCPDGSSPPTANGISACCPGILSANHDGATCLVGCSMTSSACFPFCTNAAQNTFFTVGTCTPVPVTESDYTSMVYGHAAASATATNEAKTTNTATVHATTTGAANTGSADTTRSTANTGTPIIATTITSAVPSSSTSTSTARAAETGALGKAQAVLGIIAGLALL